MRIQQTRFLANQFNMEFLDNKELISSITELEYKPNGITNKTLMDRGDMRVAMIAMSNGQSLAPHRAPVDVMIVGLEGRATVRVEHQLFSFDEKSILRFPANAIHAVEALTDFKMLLIK